jgi:hypothetical protein
VTILYVPGMFDEFQAFEGKSTLARHRWSECRFKSDWGLLGRKEDLEEEIDYFASLSS